MNRRDRVSQRRRMLPTSGATSCALSCILDRCAFFLDPSQEASVAGYGHVLPAVEANLMRRLDDTLRRSRCHRRAMTR